jgi:hypothetical protein
VNSIVVFFIRLLEVIFVVGAVGCILAVIPITAHRLFMVLFEPIGPEEERAQVVAADSQRQAA